jgi:HSP20 family protein
MTLVWNPSAEFERFFNRFAEPARRDEAVRADWVPSVDIRETEHDYLILIDLPDVRREDVDVTVDRSVLTVSVERKRPDEVGQARHSERRYGRFHRRFQLPKTVDDGRIEAGAKDGVLTLRVPKREEVKPRSIEVQVH